MILLLFGTSGFTSLQSLQAHNHHRTFPISQGRSEGSNALHMYEHSLDAVALDSDWCGIRRGGLRMRQKM
jgi:hypothetical protein